VSAVAAVPLTASERAYLVRLLRERIDDGRDEPLAFDVLKMLERALDVGALNEIGRDWERVP
jgi:hypothetical protein